MIIYFIILLLCIYSVLFETYDYYKKVKNNTQLTNNNPPEDNLEYIIEDLSYVVSWRTHFLVSVISILLIYFLTFRRIPTEWELVIGIISIVLLLTIITNFTNYHIIMFYQKNMIDLWENIKLKLKTNSK
jgi:Ca2+/Na+ antiporter